MKRLLLRIAIALLTFSAGYSAVLLAEIHNLKVEMREYEKRDAADMSYKEINFQARWFYPEEYARNICRQGLRKVKKPANASNMARCLKELEEISGDY
jgi:hypothetical protein